MSADRFIVRDARAGDAGGIARVHVDSWRETYAHLVPERFFDETAFERRESMWARYLTMDPRPGPLVVAHESAPQQRIIGFANAGPAVGPDAEKGAPPARDLHLFAIYLLAAAHGTGTGRELLEATIGDAPAQLWVLADNPRAISFYRRAGFEVDGVRFVDPEVEGLTELRMVR